MPPHASYVSDFIIRDSARNLSSAAASVVSSPDVNLLGRVFDQRLPA